jgi:GDP-D-mannose dehydratase
MYGGVRRFINVSTDEVYGETSLGCETGLDENSRLEPTNPYAAAMVPPPHPHPPTHPHTHTHC